MGTAQDQGINARCFQRFQIFPCHGFNHHVSRADSAVFHQRHKQRARFADYFHGGVQLMEHCLISTGANRRFRCNDAHLFRPGHQQRPPTGRLHHAHNGQVIFPLQRIQRGGRHRAAGNHNGFQVKGPEKTHVLPGIFQNGLIRPTTVRHPGGISKINQLLLGQNPAQRLHRRQSAQTGVKHTNRSCIHRVLLRVCLFSRQTVSFTDLQYNDVLYYADPFSARHQGLLFSEILHEELSFVFCKT